MRVIGIDPAAVGVHLCEGKGKSSLHPLPALSKVIEWLPADAMIAWDGPLTGPLDADGSHLAPADLVRRVIEAFFKSPGHDFTMPPALGLPGWSSSPQWALTRRCLGLPRVGPWDRAFADLPFHLVPGHGPAPTGGRWIVEVNATTAIWLAVRDDPEGRMIVWAHRDRPDVRLAIWRVVARRLSGRSAEELADFWGLPPPDNTEQMDALVAWLLLSRWVAGDRGVAILGDLHTGAWLLPTVTGLADAFAVFARRERERRGQ